MTSADLAPAVTGADLAPAVAGADLAPATRIVHLGRPPEAVGAAVNVPVVLSSTYRANGEVNYARSGSDTIVAFETALGGLEGGEALAFASGLAAAAAVIEGMPTGTVAVLPKGPYFGVGELFGEQARLGRMELRLVDIGDTGAVVAAIDGADLVWIESPVNPTMEIADLPVLCRAGRAAGALVVVDSTFASPLLVRPLDHGADVVMHSATKIISGHEDLLMGVLVTRDPDRLERLRYRRTNTGAIPGALESYLALRGLRTLHVRLERQQATAGVLAARLDEHPVVTRVRYPGLASDPGHERASGLLSGFGTMISFETAGQAADAERVCESLRVILHATSLGGVQSLAERRARYPEEADRGTPDTLIRFSVGLEDVEDLWTDLARALATVPG